MESVSLTMSVYSSEYRWTANFRKWTQFLDLYAEQQSYKDEVQAIHSGSCSSKKCLGYCRFHQKSNLYAKRINVDHVQFADGDNSIPHEDNWPDFD